MSESRRVFLSTLGLSVVSLGQQQSVRPEFQPVEDVPGLPRVLIIGDSISIGYTLALREALEGVANVHRPPENCESTREGLAKLDKWIGGGNWDVIHFNWGLHDVKYIDEKGDLAPLEEGEQKVPFEEYGRNLEELVRRLNGTGAALIWRPTTPIPEGARGRIPGDEDRANRIALGVMERYDIRVDDLNAFIRDQHIPHVRPDDVHFSRESSEKLGQRVAETIKLVLGGPA